MALSPKRVGGAEPLRQRREPFGPKVHSCTINREQRHDREEGAVMKRLIKPVSWLGAVAAVLLLAGAVAARSRTPAAPGAPPPPEVTVITVATQTVAAQYEYVGQAEASRRVEVRSQVTGVIVARPYTEGTDVAQGALLFRIDPTTYEAAYRSAQARLANAQRTLARLKPLLAARAVAQKDVADGTVYPRTGTLKFTDLALQPVTGTQQLRAELRNPQHLLLPGQFVRVRLLGLKQPGAILVPQRAVLQGLGGAFVYVLDAGDKVATRNVTATSWDGGSWLIEQGLAAGDRVVVDGVQQVAPGSPVRPVAYQPAADGAAARSTPCATRRRSATPSSA